MTRTEVAATPDTPRRRRWRWVTRPAGWVVKIALVVALPFVVLLRVSMHLHQDRDVGPWLALALGATLAVVVVGLYASWIAKRLTGRHRTVTMVKWVALPLVIVYTAHALLYVARVNTKTERVREYYTTVHPLLRVAVSTMILVDEEVVITDAFRTPKDYVRMGLPVFEASRHFRQPDGYVHAVDLRTIGRPAWKNLLMLGYFRLLGFRTLRHVGTADHLHVAVE